MKRFPAILFTIFLLHAGEMPSHACGIKLTIKSAPPRTAAARRPDSAKPVRTDESREVVAARAKRQPIAAGPAHTPDHQLIAAKQPTPPPAAPTDTATDTQPTTPVPAPPPAPAPAHVSTDRDTRTEVRQNPSHDTPLKPLKADAMLSELYFSVGSSSLPGHGSLDRVARNLAAHADAHVRIEGYADPTGTPEGNMTLSQERAESVRDYLVNKGIDTSRLEVKAFGDTVLKYSRTDGRNRRVAIVVQ